MKFKEFLRVFRYSPDYNVSVRFGEPQLPGNWSCQIIQYEGRLLDMPSKWFDCKIYSANCCVIKEAGYNLDMYPVLEVYLEEPDLIKYFGGK